LISRPITLAFLVLVLVALAVEGTCHFEQVQSRRRDLQETLQPIASLLDDDRKILRALESDGLLDAGSVSLQRYLERLRTDGVAKNAQAKQQIDALVSNDTMIVALLGKYIGRAQTPVFKASATAFTTYAVQ